MTSYSTKNSYEDIPMTTAMMLRNMLNDDDGDDGDDNDDNDNGDYDDGEDCDDLKIQIPVCQF